MAFSTPGPTTATASKPDQAAVRETRRKVRSLVRSDFEFHSEGTKYPSSEVTSVSGDKSFAPSNIDSERVIEWREYTFASSDPSSQSEDAYEAETFNTAERLAAESQQRLASPKLPDSSFGSKIKKKRRSLLNHILPTAHGDDNGALPSPKSSSSQHSEKRSQEPNHEASDADDDEDEKVRTEEEAAIVALKAERKRRRRLRLERERQWNSGLDFWARRRDAWCCARRLSFAGEPSQKYARQSSNPGDPNAMEIDDIGEVHDPSYTETMEVQAPGPETKKEVLMPFSNTTDALASSKATNRSASTSSDHSTAQQTNSPTSTALTSPGGSSPDLPPDLGSRLAHNTQIPIATPILPPEDPSRSQTHHPRAYGAIYSKVVVQGLTPSVPINLQTMTNALVQGWKQDGEWPPRGAANEPTIRTQAATLQQNMMGRGVRRGKEILKEKARKASASHGNHDAASHPEGAS